MNRKETLEKITDNADQLLRELKAARHGRAEDVQVINSQIKELERLLADTKIKLLKIQIEEVLKEDE